jgi:hypothetical protein
MESPETMSADLHSAAKSAFDSLLIPHGFRRTADWINTGEHSIDTGREYSRERVRVRLDWDGSEGWLDVRLAMARPGGRRVLGWEDLEAVAGAPRRVRRLTEDEQRERVESLVALATQVLRLQEAKAR